MNTLTKNDRDLRQIIIWGSAFPAGAILAVLEALQRDFSFALSFSTLIAFVLGTALVVGFWKFIFTTNKPAWHITASILMILGGIAGFLYPLRYVSPSRLAELLTGLSGAVCALSIVAVLLLKLKRFFDEDDRAHTPAPVRSN